MKITGKTTIEWILDDDSSRYGRVSDDEWYYDGGYYADLDLLEPVDIVSEYEALEKKYKSAERL